MRVFPAIFSAVTLDASSAFGDSQFSVRGNVPGLPGPGSYAAQFTIPAFNPALGTLTRIDSCVNLTSSVSARIVTLYFNPVTFNAPVGYTISLGAGASWGYFDFAGFTTVCGANAVNIFSGSSPSFNPGPNVTSAGTARSCCTFVDPSFLSRFVGLQPTGWYMGLDFREDVLSVSPPDHGSAGTSNTIVNSWVASVDVTYRYLPHCIADMDSGDGSGVPDGGVGIEDLLYYLTLYNAGGSRADVDDGSGTGHPDGGVGIEDLLYYLVRYNAGC